MSDDPLALIEAHLDAVEAMASSEDDPVPPPVDLSTAVLDEADVDRARAVLARLEALESRVKGLQTRVLGEIEGVRRPRRAATRRAPRTIDTLA